MVQVSPVGIGKMKEIEKRFQAPAELLHTVMWNPNASLPEALETRSASLSEGAAGELQYSSFSLQTSCMLLQQLKKLYLFFLPAQKEKGEEQHL